MSEPPADERGCFLLERLSARRPSPLWLEGVPRSRRGWETSFGLGGLLRPDVVAAAQAAYDVLPEGPIHRALALRARRRSSGHASALAGRIGTDGYDLEFPEMTCAGPAREILWAVNACHSQEPFLEQLVIHPTDHQVGHLHGLTFWTWKYLWWNDLYINWGDHEPEQWRRLYETNLVVLVAAARTLASPPSLREHAMAVSLSSALAPRRA